MSDPQDRTSLFESPDDDTSSGGKRGGKLGLIIGGVVIVLLLIAGAAAALVIFGGGAVQEVVQHRESNIPALLGTDTLVYGTITPALGDLPNVARLRDAYPELFVTEDPEAANEQLSEYDIRFEEDIQPWLGTEVAFAVGGFNDLVALSEYMEANPEGNPFAEQGYAMALAASTNDEAAQAFLEKVRMGAAEQDGMEFAEVEHNGVTIYEQTNPEEGQVPLAMAVARGHVIGATSADAIISFIDRPEESADTLSNSARFEQVRSNQPENTIGYIYIDMQPIVNQMLSSEEFQQELEAELPPDQLEQFRTQIESAEAIGGVSLSIAIEADGVAFDSIFTLDTEQLDEEAQELVETASQPVDASRLERISSDALALSTFAIPSEFQEQFMEGFSAQPGAEEALQDLNTQLGIDLEQDFLSWFHGPGSLVFLPGEEIAGMDVTLPATGYFALQVEDVAAAEAGMSEIATMLETQAGGMATFESATVGGVDWQAIANPVDPASTVGGYAFIDGEFVLAVGNTAMTSAAGEVSTPISDDNRFQTVSGYLPNPNSGIFYLDVQDVIAAVEAAGVSPTTPEEEEFLQNVRPIRAIGASNAAGLSDEGVGRSRLFIYIEAPEGGE
jgi:hypothetical protein